jgi:uncharacterized protein YceH (UPF0502 family)
MPSNDRLPVTAPTRSLVKGVPTGLRKALERWARAIQGNFDHMDLVITQVNEKHNNLDDNVQALTEHLNDKVADLESRLSALE